MKFELSESEHAKAKEWIESKPKTYGGAIGGRFSYVFTPTSIGTSVKVVDNLDKSELDVTDYDMW